MFSIYKDKKIFVTGNTGFVGSWLCKYLQALGAKTRGYSLYPNTPPNHYTVSNPGGSTIINDIGDIDYLRNEIQHYKPDLVIHLAAQALVRKSYVLPVETFKTNMIGTINLLESCKWVDSIKGALIITTDKIFKDRPALFGYSESDELGGYDPYSTSKACCEMITDCYRKSFYKELAPIATLRSGNIIGGGDWSEDRIIPDLIKSTQTDNKVELRYPNAVRPWLYVLDSLTGYLLLGKKFLEEKKGIEGAWNFGPDKDSSITVKELVDLCYEYWNRIKYVITENNNDLHETSLLTLNSNKARYQLDWKPLLSIEDTIKWTIDWYRNYYEKNTCITEQQINNYLELLNG
jgi:CDP-glucose 4,6-dehydratase